LLFWFESLKQLIFIMAKHLVQFILAGAQIVTRAFANAVRQEIRMSQEAAKRHSSGHSKSNQIESICDN